ncbi:MAG: DUF2332 domain-containing protein [Dongiaceae bacterium]
MSVFETYADYYRFFANESRRGGSPLYERLSLGIAGDDAIHRLAARRRRGQPAANLIFGAVHYLLLGGEQHALRDYYPSLGGSRPVDDDAFERFREFCLSKETELTSIIAKRVTNTNEVGRSALLAPAFEIIAGEAGAALGLIEIGSSAGLNLNFDRYGYRYLDDANAPRLQRRLNSSLIISCNLKGTGVPWLAVAPPPVGTRMGLELSPIDVSQESERQWLKALVWPERVDRIRRLEGALDIIARHPVRIVPGDAIANLQEALAGIPRDQARCVYHTVMAYQLNRDQHQSIDKILLEASKSAPVWRVTIEGEVSGQNPLETVTTLWIYRYMNGECAGQSFAVCDPHGLWIEWKQG